MKGLVCLQLWTGGNRGKLFKLRNGMSQSRLCKMALRQPWDTAARSALAGLDPKLWVTGAQACGLHIHMAEGFQTGKEPIA